MHYCKIAYCFTHYILELQWMRMVESPLVAQVYGLYLITKLEIALKVI